MSQRLILEIHKTGDGWTARARGGHHPYLRRRTQRHAITASAAALRHRWKARGALGQLVLHGQNGRIRWERTYGLDPRGRKG